MAIQVNKNFLNNILEDIKQKWHFGLPICN